MEGNGLRGLVRCEVCEAVTGMRRCLGCEAEPVGGNGLERIGEGVKFVRPLQV